MPLSFSITQFSFPWRDASAAGLISQDDACGCRNVILQKWDEDVTTYLTVEACTGRRASPEVSPLSCNDAAISIARWTLGDNSIYVSRRR